MAICGYHARAPEGPSNAALLLAALTGLQVQVWQQLSGLIGTVWAVYDRRRTEACV